MLNQRGSAPVEAIFGLTLLVMISLAIWQVALVIYARNVAAAAAHEGARVAVERHRDPEVAAKFAYEVVRSATGRLVDRLEVTVDRSGDRIYVLVSGRIDAIGPLPLSIPVSKRASALLFPDP